MAPPPSDAPPPEPRKAPGWRAWLQYVRDGFEGRLAFCLMLALGVYVFFFVAQISNVWRQLPPSGWWLALYAAFLVPLLAFYVGSVFVVLGPPIPQPPGVPAWLRRLSEWAWGRAAAAEDRLRAWASRSGVFRWALIVLGLAVLVPALIVYLLLRLLAVALPRGAAGWLLRLSAAKSNGKAPLPRWPGELLLVLGVVALGSGAVSDSSTLYPLVGAFCRGLGLIVAAVGVWLLSGCDEPPEGADGRRPLRGWLLLGAGLGALGVGLAFRAADLFPLAGALCRGLGAVLAGLGLYGLLAGRAHRRRGAWALAVGLALLGGGWLWGGAPAPLWVRPLCYGLGPGLVGIGLGLLYEGAEPRRAGGERTGRWYVGRLLGWLFVTAWAGEALWVLAASDAWGTFASYRLYTIWAVVQVLTFLVLLGLLFDRLRERYRVWPIRQIAALALGVAFWAFTSWETLSPAEAEGHLSADQVADVRRADREAAAAPDEGKKARAEHWFGQLKDRIAAVPEGQGPVVLVAASGGGSRAAIFTALGLESLRRTPLDPAEPLAPERRQRTWADNVVLLSSVSGGSLATAYYVQRLAPDTSAEPPLVGLRDAGPLPELRNTTRSELVSHLARLASRELEDYPAKLADQLARTASYSADDRDLAARLGQLGVLVVDSPTHFRAATAAELRDLYPKLVERRNELLKQPAPGPGGRPAGPAYVRSDVDEAFLDTLIQLIARVRADTYAQQLRAGEGTPGTDGTRAWALRSKPFDEMCLDFMAPLLRGAMSPTLDRGDALARFWTQRFGWYDATNANGYGKPAGGWAYRPYHPLALFNTTDVANGSRLVVGFPPLPDDLWLLASDERQATRARPRPLNELVPNFRVSLARAVRLSSNFPFGFRVSELGPPPGTDRPPVHMLDGGVVDNTGLDTIYELFQALRWHAASAGSPYRADAREALEGLRRRGVVLLEIDAGAKPSETTPGRFDPLAGPREPLQGMDNASYTNAEVVKQFYVRELRATLARNVDALKEVVPDVPLSLATFNEELAQKATAVHLVFQCNHYLPGQEVQAPEVMTAWALGPRDKAQVVQRFLIELELWNQHRRGAYKDVMNNLAEFPAVEGRARKLALLHLIPALLARYEGLEQDVWAGKDRGALQEREKRLREDCGRVKAEVDRAADAEVSDAWERLRARSERVARLVLRPPKRWVNAGSPADAAAALSEHVAAAVGNRLDDAAVQAARARYGEQLAEQRQAAPAAPDPQWKYDLSAQRSKLLLERHRPRR